MIWVVMQWDGYEDCVPIGVFTRERYAKKFAKEYGKTGDLQAVEIHLLTLDQDKLFE